jgi:hypothetical protein
MTVTFVSAFFAPEGGSYRSIEKYKENFARLASSGVPIVLYLDPAFREYGQALEEHFANVHIAKYLEVDCSFLTSPVYLPKNRNVQKDTVDYFCIQLMKLRVMAEAANDPVITTSHIAWIDFGIFHMFKDVGGSKHRLREVFKRDWPSDSIISPGCWEPGQYDLWNNICWRHCGSFLLGERSLFITALQNQDLQVKSNMPGLTWEINYWALMPGFTTYRANHDDSILMNLLLNGALHPDTSSS